MTTPVTEPAAPAKQPKAESFLDWFHINSRWIVAAGVVVLLAGGVAWYVPRYRTQRNENADKMLVTAKQSVAARNLPLAESDLKKVSDRYAGLPAGTEAALLLAQIRLERGDVPAAVTGLQELAGKVGTGPNATLVHTMLGDALSQANRTAEAAATYEKGAQLTSMPNERSQALAKAGHAYMAAGKLAEARKVWEALAAQQDNPQLAGEARVRLGELSVSVKS